ncbi:MAG: hypothetical protein JO304_13135 [Solirubrobacterales bacterium]|nr:hypothetical protein [Solirubrobacterales bacterium]
MPPRREVIRLALQGHAESAGVLGGHPRAPHVPSTDVSDLVDVDDAGDGGVAVPKQERDLVDALAGEQSA